MADISLPDDVFENMLKAQESAASMEATVKNFNEKVDKKFKEADTNEKSKLPQDKVNAILSAKEKTRYRNIGNVFFEGAKDSIIGIFKQIEKNKSKSLLKRAAGAVADKIKAVKEAVEEHKTGLKILGVIALLGGVYYMFKDWFDEKLPKVWDAIKEGVDIMSEAIKGIPDIVSGIFNGSGLSESISTFFSDAIKEIRGFLERMLNFFKDIFSGAEGESENQNSKEVQRSGETGEILNKNEFVDLNVHYSRDSILLGNWKNDIAKEAIEIPQKTIQDVQKKFQQLLEKATPEQIEAYKKYLKR